ncbi:hypothetical protein [Streptomyces sp. NPDC017991]|uniref:hypothetical protein n=1 Tax=Streptomyces sp. NPDC017991 TaxID=3365026 RepID=UPI00379343F7
MVLFTSPNPGDKTLVTLATGLLVIATMASLTGSIGLAAIGAEQHETANLPPAVMYIAVAVVVSIVSVLGAFEVLAAIYVPDSRLLFSLITGVGGIAGAYFTSFAVGDSWRTGPTDLAVRTPWLANQWIKTPEDAYRQAYWLAILGVIPPVPAMVFRVYDVHFKPTALNVNIVVGAGLLLAMACIFLGVQRTAHAFQNDQQKAIRWPEAYGTTVAVSLYTAVLLLFLP